MEIRIVNGNFKINATNLAFLNDNVFSLLTGNYAKAAEAVVQHIKDLSLGANNEFMVRAVREPNALLQASEKIEFDCHVRRYGVDQFRVNIDSVFYVGRGEAMEKEEVLAVFDDRMVRNRENECYMDKALFFGLRPLVSTLADLSDLRSVFYSGEQPGGFAIGFLFNRDVPTNAQQAIVIEFQDEK